MNMSADLPEAEGRTLALVQPVVIANDTATCAYPSSALSPSYAEGVLHSTTIAEPASKLRDVEAVTRDTMQLESPKRQQAAVNERQSPTTATAAVQRDPPTDAPEEASSPTDPVNSASKAHNITSVSAPPPDLSTVSDDQEKLLARPPSPASDQTSCKVESFTAEGAAAASPISVTEGLQIYKDAVSNTEEPQPQTAAVIEEAEPRIAENHEIRATAGDDVSARSEEPLPASSNVKTADLEVPEQRALPESMVTDIEHREMPNTAESMHVEQVGDESISRGPAVQESPIIVDPSALESARPAAIPATEHVLEVGSGLQEVQPKEDVLMASPELPMSPKIADQGETLSAPGSPSKTAPLSYPNEKLDDGTSPKITPDASSVVMAENPVPVADVHVTPLASTSAGVGTEGLGSCVSQPMLNAAGSSTLTAVMTSELANQLVFGERESSGVGTGTGSGAQETRVDPNGSRPENPVPPFLETPPLLETEVPVTEAASTGLNDEEESSRLATAASIGAGLPEARAESMLPTVESDNGQPEYESVNTNATEPSNLPTNGPLVSQHTEADRIPANAEPIIALVPDALETSSKDSAAEADHAAAPPADPGVEQIEQSSVSLAEDQQATAGPPTLGQTAAEMLHKEPRGVEPESSMVESASAQSASAAPEEAASTTGTAQPDTLGMALSIMESNAMDQSDGVSFRSCGRSIPPDTFFEVPLAICESFYVRASNVSWPRRVNHPCFEISSGDYTSHCEFYNSSRGVSISHPCGRSIGRSPLPWLPLSRQAYPRRGKGPVHPCRFPRMPKLSSCQATTK